MTKCAEFFEKLRMIRLTHIGVICFAFLVSVFSNSSYADNAVTGSGTECVYSTLNTYTGPSTIKANWDPNSINLYWYNDEQKLSVQTAANTCDYDSGITLPSSNPTKTGYTFTGWEVLGGVPAGYTQLEYIKSTGTQYIDTGVVPTNWNWYVEFGMSFAAAGKMFFGAGNGVWSSSSWGFQFGLANSSGNAQWGSGTGSGANVVISYLGVVANTFYDWKISKTGVYVNGVLRSSMSGNSNYTSNTRSLWIMQTNNSSASSYNSGTSSWRYVKIYNDNGDLMFNGIPAKRNSDSVLGMYDTVSGTFKTNAGSGTFTAGSVIQ